MSGVLLPPSEIRHHAAARTTLDTFGRLWPDHDEATRTAVVAVLVARADSLRTQEVIV